MPVSCYDNTVWCHDSQRELPSPPLRLSRCSLYSSACACHQPRRHEHTQVPAAAAHLVPPAPRAPAQPPGPQVVLIPVAGDEGHRRGQGDRPQRGADEVGGRQQYEADQEDRAAQLGAEPAQIELFCDDFLKSCRDVSLSTRLS